MPTPDFSNLALFPTFATCPEDPSAHATNPYFLLGQIKDDMTITKPTLVLLDRESSPFALVFDGLDRDGVNFNKVGLKKGHTAVIPNGRKVPPKEEGKRGFVSVEGARAGEECQVKGWSEGRHKEECAIIKAIKGIWAAEE
ncbi:putative zinc mynd-type domain protein [Podospora aff. communis PSN243]|uniref:Zinc mynd-type domain protein n=1 Tax=Podospora aff. communis PSN243 TaxID=3040156 RepID=A0AAV9GZN0_9PEZI|nr:putative zinc mynd-type domain protein [Podospora aff. communis PSN243]